MDSPRFSEQSSQSGSSNNDIALTSATDEGLGRIDSAFSPNAVGRMQRRRSSAITRDSGDGRAVFRLEDVGGRVSHSLQSPQPSPSGTPSNRTSLTHFDVETSSTLKAEGGDDFVNGSDDGGISAGAREGSSLAKPDAMVVRPAPLIAQPAGNSDFAIQGGLPPLTAGIKGLCAIDLVHDYERYQRGYCYELDHYRPEKSKIQRGLCGTSLDFPPLPEHPGWKGYLDPEGTRYFVYDARDSPVTVITEAWLYDQECYEEVERYMNSVFKYLRDNRKSLSQEKQFFFERERPHTDYFQIQAPVVWAAGELNVGHSDSIVGMEMKRHYWMHNEYFPHVYSFTEEDLEEIDDMLGFTFGDVLTSDTTAVNSYTLDHLKHMTEMVTRHGQKTSSKRKISVGERRTICRVVSTLYHERFLNLHGERGARLDSKQSIHHSEHRRKKQAEQSNIASGPAERRSWHWRLLPAFIFLSREENRLVNADPEPSAKAEKMHRSSFFMNVATLAMFGGPYVHASRLKGISLDQIVNKPLLQKYTEKMVAEWRDIALYGTVLLGANVAFLAIQSVDVTPEDGHTRTSAQRASYFSVLASLGTIISSLVLLILVRHREVMGDELIQRRSQSRWGLEALALMYGTPFSLVIWAILGFFVAFAFLWFESGDKAVFGIVGICLISFAIFLGWAVSASYCEDEPYEWLFMKVSEAIGSAGQALARMAKGWMPSSTGKRGRSRGGDVEMQSQTSEGVGAITSSPTGRVSSGLRAQSNAA